MDKRKLVFNTRWAFKQTADRQFEVELSSNGTQIFNEDWIDVENLSGSEVNDLTEMVIRKLMIKD